MEAIDGKPYRFVLVHTNSLREQKTKTLQKRWEKEKRELEKEAKRIGKTFMAEIQNGSKTPQVAISEVAQQAQTLLDNALKKKPEELIKTEESAE